MLKEMVIEEIYHKFYNIECFKVKDETNFPSHLRIFENDERDSPSDSLKILSVNTIENISNKN
jgi:hypothetical protein